MTGRRARVGACRPGRTGWSGLSFAVVDVETTGGSPWHGHRVTEVAAVIVRGGRVVDRFESLVNPERSIPPFITRLTHITQAMVRDQPTFREISPRIVDLLRGQVFVAHNAAFDWRFVGTEVWRAGGTLCNPRTLCTVRLARRLLPHLRRRSLDQVAMHYGIRIEARHRAMGDAFATAQCLLRLLDDAGTRGLDTWSDLDRLMRARTGAAKRRRRSALPQRRTLGARRVSPPAPLHQQRRIGQWTVHAIQAGGQRLDGGAMFGVVPKPLWVRRAPADDRNRIALGMRCLLVEHDVGPILIETGLGNKEDAEVSGHLRH